MQKLTIDRNIWIRNTSDVNGSPTHCSYLLRPSDGKMCCLGQYLKSNGISDSELLDVQAADQIDELGNKVFTSPNINWMVDKNTMFHYTSELGTPSKYKSSQASYQLMKTNDGIFETEEYRENKLTELFLKQGIEVTFIN
jgi:hypothetical protein